MKKTTIYSLTATSALILILSSFQISRGRHLYRNEWIIPSQKQLQIKNSSKESLSVVLYNTSKTEDLKYITDKNQTKVLPKNDSAVTKINFTNELYIVNNSSQQNLFKIKIINNSGKIKATVKDKSSK
ncbi:hypothetical protein [Chryseobacterium sp. YIM B08800]|uniref:hypothetical protein n=1 Tax=Chryseobacterium sp. YIM B08800 TaxID=2984136 RepID=UPI00224094B4|nr:hypothetical protein [Chryseobacterium sp. YIM B08800]